MQMNTDKRNRIIDAMDQEERNILTTGSTGSTGKEKEKFNPLITLIRTDEQMQTDSFVGANLVFALLLSF